MTSGGRRGQSSLTRRQTSAAREGTKRESHIDLPQSRIGVGRTATPRHKAIKDACESGLPFGSVTQVVNVSEAFLAFTTRRMVERLHLVTALTLDQLMPLSSSAAIFACSPESTGRPL